MVDNKKLFGLRLNTALAARDIQQIDLAKELGYNEKTANTISYWCNGKRTPNLEQLLKIAEILGVSADYLLGLSDVMTPDVKVQAICDYTGLSEDAVYILHRETELKNRFLFDILSAIISDEGLIDLLLKCRECVSRAKELEEALPQYTDGQLADVAEPEADQIRYSLYDINDIFREIINRIYPVDKIIRKARKKINEAHGNIFEAGYDEVEDDGEG